MVQKAFQYVEQIKCGSQVWRTVGPKQSSSPKTSCNIFIHGEPV